MLIDAARPTRHLAGDRWFVDETYVKVSGVWSYVYRAVDQHGQVIDVYVSQRRDIASARTFFTAALAHGVGRAKLVEGIHGVLLDWGAVSPCLSYAVALPVRLDRVGGCRSV